MPHSKYPGGKWERYDHQFGGRPGDEDDDIYPESVSSVEPAVPVMQAHGGLEDALREAHKINVKMGPWDSRAEYLRSLQGRSIYRDPKIRQEAFSKMRELSQSSPWYSVRFFALNELENNFLRDWGRLDRLTKEWVEDLRKRLKKTEIIYKSDGRDFEIPDHKARLDAFSDLRELHRLNKHHSVGELLTECYDNNTEEIQKLAGKELGYPYFMIWVHIHPVAATISGVAAAGAASGLGYMLCQYMTR